MVSFFPSLPIGRSPYDRIGARRTAASGMLLFALLFSAARLHAQSNGNSSAEFKRLAAQLSTGRLQGSDESEALQEKALGYLDGMASMLLSSSSSPDLDTANKQLAGLVSHDPPVGENYRLIRLGGTPAVYALVVNFGLGGPAAVRIYAGMGGRFVLAARIDHFTEKDFFDSDIELIPVSAAEPIFVVVAGRTDDLSTGMFSAWRFDGRSAGLLWSSDLLQQSSYETGGDGFHITYCSQPDEDHPAECPKMVLAVYRMQAGAWKQVDTQEMGPLKDPKE